MSAEPELARFDTRQGRTVQTEERSEQIDFRTIGTREQGQLALNELDAESRATAEQRNTDTRTTEEPTREDLEAALGCVRATIDGLHEQVAQLEAERDRLREQVEADR